MSEKYILIVDDDERVLFVLNRALRALENGYRVEIAQSGFEAVEIAQRRPMDLLITDLVMPGMDGVELTEAVRSLDTDVAVIWITGHGCHQSGPDAARLSIQACLEKPISVKEIRQIALRVLKDEKSTSLQEENPDAIGE